MRALRVFGIFLLGLVGGVIGAFYLASRAAPTYSRSLEIGYSFEQQRQAALFAKNGHWFESAAAYRNIALLEPKTGKPFGVESQRWDLLFPLASLVLERLSEASDPTGKGRAISVGVSHARYALALEKMGRIEESTIEWDRALKLGGFQSIETARKLAVSLLDQDIEFFNAH